MNYQQFVVTMKEKVESLLDTSISVTIHTTLKNNGRERTGLTISTPQTKIAPTIYLEEFYQHYEADSLDEISELIVSLYQKANIDHEWNLDNIKDFSVMKSKIVPRLIHAEKNKTYLQSVPHILYLDFAITFYILLESSDTDSATIPITNELMNIWQTNVHDLHSFAMHNTLFLLPASFLPMKEMVEKLIGPCHNQDFVFGESLYVLTNQLGSFGAACILYPDILIQIAGQLGESYYILPSSIHEVIILPKSQAPTLRDLNDMVLEINETQVQFEEVLSDHAYYYDANLQLLFPNTH